MSLTSKGPLFLKVSVPEGMDAALEGLTRQILKQQPRDIYWFAAQHFETLVRLRDMSAHTAGLSPSSTHGSEKAGIPQDATADVADLVDQPEKEPLDITDIQNENDINLTEKNELAPEPNGTIKTDDDGVTKAIAAATVTAAAVGAVSAAKAAEKEETETGEISTQNETSPEPGTETIDEVRVVKSPEPADGDVVAEVSSAAEEDGSRPPSTALENKETEITEEAPIESVPEDRPSTAKSDTTLEQGSRPASASQIVERGENDDSRPKSGINYEAEGTRPISASSTKDNSVPDPEEVGVRTPSTHELARSRPDSSVERETEIKQEIATESFIDTNKVEDRPSSVLVAEDSSEQPSAVESRPSTAADAKQAQSDQEEVQLVNSVKEKSSRPPSAVELTEEGSRPSSTVVDADLTIKENIPLSATENEPTSRSASAAESAKEDKSRPDSAVEPMKEENVSASVSKDSEGILEEQSESRPDSVAASAVVDETSKGDIPDETTLVEDENQSIVTESVKENISRPTSSIKSTEEQVLEEEESKPLTSAESNNEEPELSRPVSMSDSVKAEAGTTDNISESIEDEAVRPESSTGGNVEVQKQSEENQSLSGVESTDIEQKENRPETSLVTNTEESEGAISEQGNDIPPVKEEEVSTSSAIDIKELVSEELESRPISVTKSAEENRSRPISEAESNKAESELAVEEVENTEITQAQECIESRPGSAENSTKQETSRPVSVTSSPKDDGPEEINNINDLEATKGGGSRPVSVTEVNIPPTAGESRPVSATEVANEGEAVLDGAASSTKEEESEAVALEEPTKDENRLVNEAELIQKDVSRAASTEEYSKEENSNEHFLTQADEQNAEVSAAELIKDENRSASVAESSKGEGSRPPSSAELAKEKNESSHEEQENESRPISTGEPTKENESRPVSTGEPTKENESRPVSTGEPTKENESRPVSTGEPTKESGSRPASVADSIKENESRPISIADSPNNEISGVEESMTGGSRPESASELVKIEDRPASTTTSGIEEVNRQSPALQNAEDSLQLKESRPVSVTESNKDKDSRPNSSVEIEQSSEEQISSEMIKDNDSSEKNINETKFQEDEAIEKVDETDAADDTQAELTKSPSPVAEQEDAVKETSRPSSSSLSNDVKEGDGSSIAGVVHNVKDGADVALEDASKENIEEPAIEETKDSPRESVQANRGVVPSLTITEAADEPGSDNETDQPTQETNTTEVVETQEEPPAEEDGTTILNSAATTIQASFRGYKVRKARNNDVEIEKPRDSAVQDSDIAEPSEQQNTETEERLEPGHELQKPQECDEMPVTQENVTDSSLSTAATKIQAGVRGFLTRRHIQRLKTSSDSQQSLGDTVTSPDEEEDEGVQTSGSMETEVQKQHHVTMEEDEQVSEFQKETAEEVQKGLSLDSQLDDKQSKTPVVRSAVSLQLDGPVNGEEDMKVWQTLQQEQLEDAATKIQSNYRGYRTRRSLKREDAVQMPTTSSSTTSSDPPQTVRHSGEFHDMVVLPEEDAIDASAEDHVASTSSTPLQPDGDVTATAENQETDVTELNQDKMDDTSKVRATEAATKIQASYRGFKARKDMKTANVAASKIQAGFRGYKVRKQLRENAVDVNKNGPRKQGSRPQSANFQKEEELVEKVKEGNGNDEERSATKIQAGVRGYLTRKKQESEREAAVKIQAGYRGYKARKDVKARLQQRAK